MSSHRQTIAITFRPDPTLVARVRAVAGERWDVVTLGDNLPLDLQHLPFPSQRERFVVEHGGAEAVRRAAIVLGFWGPELHRVAAAGGTLAVNAPHLRWVQLTRAGAEGAAPLLEEGILTTNAAGTNAVAVAEFAVAAMLAFAKDQRRSWRAQEQRRWDRFVPRTLQGRVVGIVGMGRIGSEVARRAIAFGCQVVGIRRSVERRETDPTTGIETVPIDALNALLARSDYLVLSAPLTAQTRGLVDRGFMQQLKRGAFLINVARGEMVVEDELVQALRTGALGGAALDVFATEPLPADSPLWTCDNVFVSAHISGGSDCYEEQVMELFLENLARYERGATLRNVVGHHGY